MKNLSKNEDGVVSFEYVIVAACIVAAVALRSVLLRYWYRQGAEHGDHRDRHGRCTATSAYLQKGSGIVPRCCDVRGNRTLTSKKELRVC